MDKIDLKQVAAEMFPAQPERRQLGTPAGTLKLVPLRLVALPEGVMKDAPLRDLKRGLETAAILRQEQVQVVMTASFARALLEALQS